jgi:hypothetical protein
MLASIRPEMMPAEIVDERASALVVPVSPLPVNPPWRRRA